MTVTLKEVEKQRRLISRDIRRLRPLDATPQRVFISNMFDPHHMKFLIENHPKYFSGMNAKTVAIALKYLYANTENTSIEFLEKAFSTVLFLKIEELAYYVFYLTTNKKIRDLVLSKFSCEAERLAFLVLITEDAFSMIDQLSFNSLITAYGKETVPYMSLSMTVYVLSRYKRYRKQVDLTRFKKAADQRHLIKNAPWVVRDMTLEQVRSTFVFSGSQWLRIFNGVLKKGTCKKIDYLPHGMLEWMQKDIMRGSLGSKAGYKRIPDMPKNLSEKA